MLMAMADGWLTSPTGGGSVSFSGIGGRMSRRGLFAPFAAVAVFAFVAASLTSVRAGQTSANTVAIGSDDIGGVVTGARGPEAGVWVIAETRDTPTRLIKIV